MFAQNLVGKKIIVTAGRLREDIDGVRHYANHRRPEGQGYAVAANLAAQGAEVTVVAPRGHLISPPKCRLVQELADKTSVVSADDSLKAVEALLAKNSYDAVLCLASAASIRPFERAKNKLKMKAFAGEAVSMSVVGNVDIEKRAGAWGVPVLGYNSWQETFSSPTLPEGLAELTPIVGKQQDSYYLPPSLDAGKEPLLSGAVPTLNGKKVMITSGPTEEVVTATGDVITNFSSGKQGSEVARAFARSGAKVIFVAGPTGSMPATHANIQIVRTTSAKSMLAACLANLPVDVFVGVAAVADFGCEQPFQLRLKENQKYDLVLDQNPDILETMGFHPQERPSVVGGFAAETDPDMILDYAKEKLVRKNADLICANLVGSSQAHGKDDNRIIFVERGANARPLAVMSKSEAAAEIVREVAARFPAFSAQK
ncbi:MAG: phosphopantothenoylcysteine decarboxylase [Bdellovibrionales bacterium]